MANINDGELRLLRLLQENATAFLNTLNDPTPSTTEGHMEAALADMEFADAVKHRMETNLAQLKRYKPDTYEISLADGLSDEEMTCFILGSVAAFNAITELDADADAIAYAAETRDGLIHASGGDTSTVMTATDVMAVKMVEWVVGRSQ